LAVFEANTDMNSVVIDIGAHCCFYSIFLAKRVKKVYSIEPQPYIFSILERNISLNNCYNVQALNIAAYDTKTTLSLAPPKDQVVPMPIKNGKINYDRCDNSAGLALSPCPGEIRATRMDDLIPQDETVSFIKCDAQGADLRALKGSNDIIHRCRPTILFEFEEMLAKIYGDTWRDYEVFFDQMGYRLEPVRNPIFQPGKQPYQEYLCKPV
jgi:FkbM family methyltransferase